MIIRKRILGLMLATACSIGATAALAADYEPPVFEAPAEDEYVPVEVGNGWYLRGDIAYSFNTRMGNPDYRTFSTPPATYGSDSFDSADLSKELSYGIGFGYRFTDYLRADLTWDLFKGDFSGTTSAAFPCGAGEPANSTCRTEDSASMTGNAVMANAYFDIGTFNRFTPYLGGGLGMARVSWSTLSNRPYCVDGPISPADDCTATVYGSVAHEGESSWRFAYSAMAGVAYDISANLKLDLGYRFRHIAGGDMFNWDAASAASGANGIQGSDNGYSTHDVKVGLRYELW